MARDIGSEQQSNIEFVKLVEQHPCLYNFELPSYSRKDITDKEWKEIGKTMNMTPSACRERWRNLRSVFMRNYKARKGASKKKPYYLSEAMQFVIPYMRPLDAAESKDKPTQLTREVARISSESDPLLVEIGTIKVEKFDIDEEDIEVHTTASSQTRKRLRDPDENNQQPNKMQTATNVTVVNDAVKSFIDSLLPELNEMSTAQFKSFKRRVLVLIDDITTDIPRDT